MVHWVGSVLNWKYYFTSLRKLAEDKNALAYFCHIVNGAKKKVLNIDSYSTQKMLMQELQSYVCKNF